MNLKEIFQGVSGGKILDVGTGIGDFVDILQECLSDYSEIVGIDTGEAALARARDHFKQNDIKFLLMDAGKMEFEDNSFDTVCMSNTLHHLSDINIVLNEMKRVVKPGGLFIINEMFCDNQTERQMSHVNVHHFQCDVDTLLGRCHNRTYRKQEIIDIVNNLGLSITGMYEHNTHEEQLKEADYNQEKKKLDEIFPALENRLEHIKGLKQYDELKNRLDELKSTLYDKGIFSATNLMIICRK